jgi:hypothetical protein
MTQLDLNFNVVKKCNKCKQDKAAEDFHKGRPECKECRKEYKKAYCKQNREKINERQKAYRKQNRDKIRIYKRNKRKTNLNYKLADNLRSRLRQALNGKSKSKNTLKLLGCSVDFLKKYLENQFQPGMSWENYGKYGWHIDHIVPCASFNLSDPKQQQKCFHYSNLQPLWAEDNTSKGAKIN